MKYDYDQSMKGSHYHDRASCARFCFNVCSLFSNGRKQCFKDCMECQSRTKGRQAKHGWISCSSNDCGC